MNWLWSSLRGAASAAGSTGKFMFNHGAARMAGGAVVGGAWGGLTSDQNTKTGVFKDVVAGAGIGLGIGTLSTKTSLRAIKGLGMGAARRTPGIAWWGAKKATNIAGWGMRNPKKAVSLGLASAGLYGLANSGYGDTNASTETMQLMAQRQGGPSTGMHGKGFGFAEEEFQVPSAKFRHLKNSTEGLVFGLHNGRHR